DYLAVIEKPPVVPAHQADVHGETARDVPDDFARIGVPFVGPEHPPLVVGRRLVHHADTADRLPFAGELSDAPEPPTPPVDVRGRGRNSGPEATALLLLVVQGVGLASLKPERALAESAHPGEKVLLAYGLAHGYRPLIFSITSAGTNTATSSLPNWRSCAFV